MAYFKNAGVLDYSIRSSRLCIPFSIVANATPANKLFSVDLPSGMILSLQGLTAAAAAIDAGANFLTPTDSTGVFGILLYNLGPVQKVLRASIDGLSSGTIAVALEGASGSGVTASGNIAISATSSVSFATTNLSGVLSIDFISAQD